MSVPAFDQAHVDANSDPLKMSENLKGSGDERRGENNEYTPLRFLHRITALLAHYGVETHGCVRVCSTR